MRPALPLLFAIALSLAGALPAAAQQAEAKEAARNANCQPGKLDVLKQVAGRMAETVYKITCTGQKAADGKEVFVVIQCRDRICVAM